MNKIVLLTRDYVDPFDCWSIVQNPKWDNFTMEADVQLAKKDEVKKEAFSYVEDRMDYQMRESLYNDLASLIKSSIDDYLDKGKDNVKG